MSAVPPAPDGSTAAAPPLRPPTERPELGDWAVDSRERRHTVGVLAIALGFLGVHKFLLGYRFAGVLMLLLSFLTCGAASWVIGVIEGSILLTMSDEDFRRLHIDGRRPWF